MPTFQSSISWCCLLSLLLVSVALPPSVFAQQTAIEDMKEFNAGDLDFRTHVHLEFDPPDIVRLRGQDRHVEQQGFPYEHAAAKEQQRAAE